MAELCVKISNNPNNTKKITIGISHQSFLCHKKTSNSLNISNLNTKFFIAPIIASYYYGPLPLVARPQRAEAISSLLCLFSQKIC